MVLGSRSTIKRAVPFGIAALILTVGGCRAATLSSPASGAAAHAPPVSYQPGRFVSRPLAEAAADGIRKIKHVVIITQENRSFDSYFGTYPGALGLGPVASRACVPQREGPCIKPFHTRQDLSAGGPHGRSAAVGDIDGGAMDGFVRQAEGAQKQCADIRAPQCGTRAARKVMGYYNQHEIPNYWDYARHFVLQDHFFEATDSWSLPQHLYELSGWAATCKTHDPASCHTNLDDARDLEPSQRKKIFFAWTDITYLLHAYGVSWRYYVQTGQIPDCQNPNRIVCPDPRQAARIPGVWSPLPQFDTVRLDRQRRNVVNADGFFPAARAGRLPAVSWVVPSFTDSEHPPARVSDGQAWVTRLVNAVMKGPDWKSTAIFLNWDDWGGYYDGVSPPRVDAAGYGLRVPGLVISPYAKAGHIDHQVLSTDAYLKFIEDRWLDGQRLNPRTDGRPDPRPDVRESIKELGDLLRDFNFHQKPLPPLILPERPHTDLVEPPGYLPPTEQCPSIYRCQANGHRRTRHRRRVES